MASGPWDRERQTPEHKLRTKREVLRIKDQRVATLREKYPRRTRAYDASEWFAVLLAAAVMQKAFPDQEPLETLNGIVRVISSIGLATNIVMTDLPAPSQWPRVVRKLRDSDWWNDGKDAPK